MPRTNKGWQIESVGDAREVYTVEATTEEEARQKFLAGEDSYLVISEVSGTVVDSSIRSITLEDEV